MNWIRFFKRFGPVVFLMVLAIGLCYSIYNKGSIEDKENTYINLPENEPYRKALESFTDTYFLEDGFFRTGLADTDQQETASGQDVLSESVGLLMLYYLKWDRPAEFGRQVDIINDYFFNNNGLIKWRIRREKSEETVNATIDDFRIIKALLLAGSRWGRDDYIHTAKELSARLLIHCVTGDSLKSFDSPDSPEAPFAYYDFEAMQLMGRFDKEWKRLSEAGMKNILNRKVEGLPFFRDAWFSGHEGYPTLENLLILMHLSEAGVKDTKSAAWLKGQLKGKGLFGSYSVEGKPLSPVESPAIYAAAALIGDLYGDRELYSLANERLKGMQNMKKNEYYGGFIDLSSISAYSFDQLMPLLAY